MRSVIYLFLLFLLLPFIAPSPARAEEAPRKIAVFDFELIDNTGDNLPETVEAQKRRLILISDQLREKLGESAKYELVDLSPAADRIAATGELRYCGGCGVEIAKSLGAELALTGVVQKMSNWKLSIDVLIHDVASGKAVESYSVGVRGNDDKSWNRGVSWLLRNRLLKKPE